MTIQRALELALDHHQAGRMLEARGCYHQILAHDPNHADALHLLGVLALQSNQLSVAFKLITKAIASSPRVAEYRNNLGTVLINQGRVEDAISEYRRAVDLLPDYAEAFYNLGLALSGRGAHDEAVVALGRALELEPDSAAISTDLGIAHYRLGRCEEAIHAYHRALEIDPGNAAAHNNLGVALDAQGRLQQAEIAYREALRLEPGYAEALNNLGISLQKQIRLNEALAAFQSALRIKPDYVEAQYNLGVVLRDKGQLDAAAAALRKTIELAPTHLAAHANLGMLLQKQGDLDAARSAYEAALRISPEDAALHNALGTLSLSQGNVDGAIDLYRRAMELKISFAPSRRSLDVGAALHSNLVYALHFHPDSDARSIYMEHRRWNERHAVPLRKFGVPHSNNRDSDRRLRIGYVSPDFRKHVVGRFLLPLIESRDRGFGEVFCYSDVTSPDELTKRFQAGADQWREIANLSDEEVAAAIRTDQIDILIDLTMHMDRNRLLVFARKPAPIQMTYLAYASTTGLDAMDYRLTDPFLDPPGLVQEFYSEASVSLADSYWCYQPPTSAGAVNHSPAATNDYVTFGCLNNFCKISAPTLDAWRKILLAVPRSRIIIHAHAGSHRDRVCDLFAAAGVDAAVVTFVGHLQPEEYFALYGRIDLALDPFPYTGGTTTCDALWMGVPVISLAGQTVISRGGLSILSNVGLPELVAYSRDDYVRLAVDWANNLPRLAETRATLRSRMQASALMDVSRFVGNVEVVYRRVWQKWCARSPSR